MQCVQGSDGMQLPAVMLRAVVTLAQKHDALTCNSVIALSARFIEVRRLPARSIVRVLHTRYLSAESG